MLRSFGLESAPRLHRATALCAVLCGLLGVGGCGLGDVGPDLDKWQAEQEADAKKADSSGDSLAGGDAAGGDTAGATDTSATKDGAIAGDGGGSGGSGVDVSGLDGGAPADTAGDVAAGDTTGCTTNKDCDDNDACTVNSCDNGACLPAKATSCDDGNACTKDGCDAKSGCLNPADDTATCTDGDACTLGDACKTGACLPAAVTSCDDGNACTKDSCAPKTGCAHVVTDGAACDDGDHCTAWDRCDQAVCKGEAGLFEATAGLGVSGQQVLGALVPVSDGRAVALLMGVDPTAAPYAKSGVLDLRAPGTTAKTLMLEGAPTVPAAGGRNTDGSALLVGRTISPGRKARTLHVSTDGAITVAKDTLHGDWGTMPRDMVAGAEGWLVVGALQPGDAYSRAWLARVKPDGSALSSQLLDRRHGAALWSVTEAGGKSGGWIACGAVEEHGGGGKRAWLISVDKAGKSGAERTFGGAWERTCKAVARVDGGVLMAGEERDDDVLTAGFVQRVDDNGAVLWAKELDGGAGASMQAIAVLPGGRALVAGNAHNHAKQAQTTAIWLLSLDVDSGQQAWQRKIGGGGFAEAGALAIGATGHVWVGGRGGKSAAEAKGLVVRTNAFGHATCKDAGKCAKIKADACGKSVACQLWRCDPAQGCVTKQRTGPCDDGSACTVGADCQGGSCEAGVASLGALKLGKFDKGRALTADGEGGWLIGGSGGLALQRLDARGKATVKMDLSFDKAALLRRTGDFVQVFHHANDGIAVQLRSLTTGKPPEGNAAFVGANETPLMTELGHVDGANRAVVIRALGDRVAAISTFETGGGASSKVQLGVSGVLKWDLKQQMFASDKPTYAAITGSKPLASADLSTEGDSDLWVLANIGKVDAGQVILGSGAQVTRHGVDGKTAWTWKQEVDTSKERLWGAGLLGRAVGTTVVALVREEMTTGKGHLHRIVGLSAAGKQLWSTDHGKALMGERTQAALLRVGLGDTLVALQSAGAGGGAIDTLRLDSAGKTVAKLTPTLPGQQHAPIAWARDLQGRPTLLVHSGELLLWRTSDWLHADCTAAGKCSDKTEAMCGGGGECLLTGCDPKAGCTTNNAPDGGACDDGNVCMAGGKCGKGVCAGGQPKTCNDNVACSTDLCVAASGQCTVAYESAACAPKECHAASCTKSDCEYLPLSDVPCGAGKVCKNGACTKK